MWTGKGFFVECKSRTRKKAREFRTETGASGRRNAAKPLTKIEDKLMRLLGWVSVHGCTEMPKEIDIQDKDDGAKEPIEFFYQLLKIT